MYNHSESNVTWENLEDQLEKIFRHPLFHESDILKRFLEFIVQETLKGRANCLKEYTIAVHALNKPANFRPRDNGIVRIHAGRLRRALKEYYAEFAAPDEIRICIPKGKYVPVFGGCEDEEEHITAHDHGQEERNGHWVNRNFLNSEEFTSNESISISVLPFSYPVNRDSVKMFGEGLCMQLGSSLMQIRNVSVIAFKATKSPAELEMNFKDIFSSLGTDYLISGNVQNVADRLRVNIQLISAKKTEQVWAGLYEKKMTPSNIFELQDEISSAIMREIRKSISVASSRTPSIPIAVAAV